MPDDEDQRESRDLLIAFTRMEAKVDIALAQHGAKLDEIVKDVTDHETRVRVIEGRSTVTPMGLWSAVLGAITAFGLLTTLYDRFMI